MQTTNEQRVTTQNAGIIFPRPFAFAIDDLGWNIGNNSGDVDEVGPYRIGLDRKMDIKDYKAIVEVCKAVGVRVQGLFVLSEMDRENILAKFPTTTWQGANWDNSANVCPEQVEIMKYVQENAAHLEFGLHGLGHEYWLNGQLKRAEWYNKVDNYPWPEEIMKEHIQCFKKIMAQYGLSEENGHSFPESFVPCSYAYYWNPQGKYSTGKIMSEAGVKYANTLFEEISELNPPKGNNGGGFDNGIVVVNRITYGNEWFELSKLPTVDLELQESDMIESHWSNWLAQDDFMQEETNKKWIEYYKMVQSNRERYAAKNSEQFYSQWLYKKYTMVSEREMGTVEIDNRNMPDEYYQYKLLNNMVLKLKLAEGFHVSMATLNDKPIASYYEEAGYGFIYLPMLNKERYVLKYSLAATQMPFAVINHGTYNVYSVEEFSHKTLVSVKIYGNQRVYIKCKSPKSVSINNKDIKLLGENYDVSQRLLRLDIRATNIQGNSGIINLKF
ncbi:MAG: hypothetical protein AB7E36_08470 [Salinivirgaceae bacterium]